MQIDYSSVIKQVNSILLQLKHTQNKTVFVFDFCIENINDLNVITQYCIESNISMIYTINRDTLYDTSILEYYSYLSDIDISFRPNESGHSKDLDGLIKINNKTLNDCITESFENKQIPQSNNNNNTVLRYSIKENMINFFTYLII